MCDFFKFQNEMKAIEQYFHVMLFFILYNRVKLLFSQKFRVKSLFLS